MKSYHSRPLPMIEAATARQSWPGAVDSVAAWADMGGSSNARSERRKREGARPVPAQAAQEKTEVQRMTVSLPGPPPLCIQAPQQFEFGFFYRIVTYSRSGELSHMNRDGTVVKYQCPAG